MNIFKSEHGKIREITRKGEPWFVAKDVCDILNYSNYSKAIKDHVDNEDKLNNKSLSSLGQRGGWLINESGLYSLILKSNMPEAKKFKRWVTNEVLPSIRKTGKYEIPKEERKQSKIVRNSITNQWQDHGIKGHNFMNLTKHIKKISGLNKPKDQLTKKELAKLTAIEAVESYKLMNSNKEGYYPLKDSVTNTVGLIESNA